MTLAGEVFRYGIISQSALFCDAWCRSPLCLGPLLLSRQPVPLSDIAFADPWPVLLLPMLSRVLI